MAYRQSWSCGASRLPLPHCRYIGPIALCRCAHRQTGRSSAVATVTSDAALLAGIAPTGDGLQLLCLAGRMVDSVPVNNVSPLHGLSPLSGTQHAVPHTGRRPALHDNNSVQPSSGGVRKAGAAGTSSAPASEVAATASNCGAAAQQTERASLPGTNRHPGHNHSVRAATQPAHSSSESARGRTSAAPALAGRRQPLADPHCDNPSVVEQLQAATSAEEVQRVVQARRGDMHAVALSVAWQRLARLQRAGAGLAAASDNATSATGAATDEYEDATVASTSYQAPPVRGRASRGRGSGVATSADIAAAAAALSALLPTRLAGYSPRQVANTLHSMAALRQRDRPAVLALLAAAAPQLASFGPQELSNTLWSLGELRLKPPADWWPAFYSASQPLLARMQPCELAVALWALPRVAAPPPPPGWAGAALRAATAQLPSYTPQNIANLLSGLVHLLPAAPAMPPALAAAPATVAAAPCAATPLDAVAEWPGFQAALLSACASRWADFDAQALSQTLLAAARLGVRLPAGWLAGVMPHVLRLLPAFTAVHLTHVLQVCCVFDSCWIFRQSVRCSASAVHITAHCRAVVK